MTCTWPIGSSETLTFSVHQKDESWNDVAGLYIFAGFSQQRNLWLAYYVGQADSLRTRIPQHEQWDAAHRLGATHVHALVVSQQATRNLYEARLIRNLQPPLNQQLK